MTASSDAADARGVSRRAFLKSAVAIGGSTALAACLDRESVDVPRGPEDPGAAGYPARQHAWNDALVRDDAGNVTQPRHHVLLLLDYGPDGVPTETDRTATEAAFRSLERAYERSNEGLLFTASYAPAYFERFENSLPPSVDVPDPAALAPFEDPELDTPDALVHLASDHAQVVLGAEAALRGETDERNGVSVRAFPEALAVSERRTGFIGAGLPADNQDVSGVPDSEPVPEDSPLYMGFKSGFEGNQASENRVTIGEGPFDSGTTVHLSKIRLNLTPWYEQDDRFQREAKMFCPHHAKNDTVEGVGDNLGTDTEMDDCDDPEESARNDGVVGHSQKLADVREDDEPLILRRDFDSTDDDEAGVHFLSLQSAVGDFVETREAMNGTDIAADSAVGQRTNNGILQYMNVQRRGNYLMPPRSLRALPPAAPGEN